MRMDDSLGTDGFPWNSIKCVGWSDISNLKIISSFSWALFEKEIWAVQLEGLFSSSSSSFVSSSLAEAFALDGSTDNSASVQLFPFRKARRISKTWTMVKTVLFENLKIWVKRFLQKEVSYVDVFSYRQSLLDNPKFLCSLSTNSWQSVSIDNTADNVHCSWFDSF